MTRLRVPVLLLTFLAFAVARQSRSEPAPPDGNQIPQDQKVAHTDLHGDPLPPGAVARLGTVRFRHGGLLFSLAFSADGKFLASASTERTIRLWDMSTGKQVRQFREGGPPVAISRDGKILASGGWDQSVHLWDMATGKELHKFPGRCFSLALSPDGRILAAGNDLCKVSLWDVATGTKLFQLRPDESNDSKYYPHVAFSPDGKILASAGSMDKSIRLWDVASGTELRRLKGNHPASVSSLVFASAGKTLASSSESEIHLWDIAAGKEIRNFSAHGQHIYSVAFSPDGKWVATASGALDPYARVWEAATGKERLAVLHEGVSTVAFSPDARTLATGSYLVRLWDLATGKEIRNAGGHQGPISSVAFSPDGQKVVSGGRDKTVRQWDVATGKELGQVLAHQDWIVAAAFWPDANTLASVDKNQAIRFWNATNGKELRKLPHKLVVSAAFSPDGKTVAFGGWDATIQLWDGAERRNLGQLQGHEGVVSCLSFSPNGKLLASGGGYITRFQRAYDKTVRIWELATGREVFTLAGHEGEINSVTFSSEGQFVASGSTDKMIYLWDVVTGKRVLSLAGHQRSVTAVAFSPKGRILASGSGSEFYPDAVTDPLKIRLWDTATGKEIGQLQGHDAHVTSLAFSPDGTRLASALDNTSALIWDLTSASQLQQLPAKKLSPKDLDNLWTDLASDDAPKAYQAIWTLAASAQAIPFLKNHLKPAAEVDDKKLRQLIADLDNEQFAVRETASRELGKLGDQIESALRQALRRHPSAEARSRIEALLARPKMAGTPETLRRLRAIHLLEQIGSKEAGEVLEFLGKGADSARETQYAKAALKRLEGRAAGPR